MSFLDMDERLLEIAERADIVYSPLVDTKEYPADVDVCLVEGRGLVGGRPPQDPTASESGRRRWSRSVTARSPPTCPGCATRSASGRSWSGPTSRTSTLRPGIPLDVVPALLPTARPVHRVVNVDVFLPGCPPSADLIYRALVDLIEGRTPDTTGARFGR